MHDEARHVSLGFPLGIRDTSCGFRPVNTSVPNMPKSRMIVFLHIYTQLRQNCHEAVAQYIIEL